MQDMYAELDKVNSTRKFDFVDDKNKGWYKKEGEGMTHLQWRASGNSGEEPPFGA